MPDSKEHLVYASYCMVISAQRATVPSVECLVEIHKATVRKEMHTLLSISTVGMLGEQLF